MAARANAKPAVGAAIARAREAVATGDLEGALEMLIAAYGIVPAREIAELVAAVSGKLPLGAPIKSKTGRGRFERAEAAARACDIPMQLAGHAYLDDGLAILANNRPPDPRITDEILADLKRLPHRSAARLPYYDALCAALVRTRDPAIAPRLRDDVRPGLAALKVAGVRAHVEALVDRTVTKVAGAPPPALATADARAVAELRTALGASDREGDVARLYAAVYANPADVAPRLVLLDALQDTRDPRAELLALQLAATKRLDAKGTKRAEAIVKQHRVQLLGAIEPWLMTGGLVFARGFPIAGRLKLHAPRGEDPCSPARAPLWSTFEELDFSDRHDEASAVAMLAHPELRRLRCAQFRSIDQALALAESAVTPLPITAVKFQTPEDNRPAALKQLRATAAFANVVRVIA